MNSPTPPKDTGDAPPQRKWVQFEDDEKRKTEETVQKSVGK